MLHAHAYFALPLTEELLKIQLLVILLWTEYNAQTIIKIASSRKWI